MLVEVSTEHPLLQQEYAVYTPPMDEMITCIGDWIDMRLTGGYIYGPSRFGKSRGIKWHVRAVLEERFQSALPMVVWVRPPTLKSESDFWNSLLKSTGFHFEATLKPKKRAEARNLFIQQLITLARLSRQNYCMIIIDEAQDVSLNEWQWLLGIQNHLDYEGIRLSIFSIGSHQIDYKPNYLARTGNAHIAARFFPVDAKFHGIRSKEELEYVLNGYDEDSEWPEESGISFLRYFAPDSYSEGRRLVSLTQELWKAFETLLPKGKPFHGKLWNFEVPMIHIALVVETLLRKLASGSSWDDIVNPPCILNIIGKTGYTDHIANISTPV